MHEYLTPHTESAAPLLAAFDAVATEGHVTRAADLLGVPQSSVSRRLRALEKAVGLDLFQPAGRGVALSTAGRELHQRTSPLVHALNDAIDVVRADADPSRGLVRFGCPLTVDAVRISSVLAEFHTIAPDVRVHLAQAHGEALAEMIRDGRLDLAVMIPPADDLPSTPLGRQEIFLHTATSHPLARRSEVDLEELKDAAFVATPPTFHLRHLLDSWCAEVGFTPRVPFEINEVDTIRVLVAQGLGVALLPTRHTGDTNCAVVPLVGVRQRSIGLSSGHHQPNAVVRRFRDHVIEQFS